VDVYVPVYTISGKISTDKPDGGANGATVQLKRNGFNVGTAVITDLIGDYSIPVVRAGNGYTIEVTLTGYKSAVFGAFDVSANVTGKNLTLIKEYLVTTLAGSTQGSADGIGTAAQFYWPYGVAVDSTGSTVYVADYNNQRIRKITSAGVVTTLAGSTYGYADRTGTLAQFRSPYGVAVDSSGSVYVADRDNHRIRKITSTGVVTTLAGSTYGYADGTGTAAQFFSPSGVAVYGSGNVYVADTYNNRIRKLSP
jgi:DNA-binding beta-propeller fold protein YncE